MTLKNMTKKINKTSWPKILPQLTPEQIQIRDSFMRDHLEAMQHKWYGVIENFNHGYPLKSFSSGSRTLEVGAGIGSHLNWENYQVQDYYALELREDLVKKLSEKYPGVHAITADCQEQLPFENNFFSRIMAIHVLEHLPNLPAALREIHRVLAIDGKFSVVIPCEGGLAYSLARNISGKRHFEKKYHQSYDWLIKSEHVNLPQEILTELEQLFTISHQRFYPLYIPIITLNLSIGLTLTKKNL
jgi:SAM-dependent methyltransferase